MAADPDYVPEWAITPAQAQRAHDIMAFMLRNHPPHIEVSELHSLLLARDCLCWALGHVENAGFGALITQLEQGLATMGIHLPYDMFEHVQAVA